MERTIPLKDVVKLARRTLKQAFPTVAFRSTYSSRYQPVMSLYWTDGPSDEEVKDLLKQFIGYEQGFLNITDVWEVSRLVEGEKIHYDLFNISRCRFYSRAFLLPIAETVSARYRLAVPDIPPDNEWGWTSFDKRNTDRVLPSHTLGEIIMLEADARSAL